MDFSFNRTLDNYKDPYHFITTLKLSSDNLNFSMEDKFKRLESSKII